MGQGDEAARATRHGKRWANSTGCEFWDLRGRLSQNGTRCRKVGRVRQEQRPRREPRPHARSNRSSNSERPLGRCRRRRGGRGTIFINGSERWRGARRR